MWDFLVSHIGCFDESMYTGVFLISLTDCLGDFNLFVLIPMFIGGADMDNSFALGMLLFLIEGMLVGNLNRTSQLIWLSV